MSSTNRANKSALFGAAPVKKAAAALGPSSASRPVGTSASAPKSVAAKSSGMPVISPTVKAEKLKAAKELHKAGDEYLKTSIFKWSADHLGASSKFEDAATAYKVAGELDLACQMLEAASRSHAAYASFGAAATSLVNASKMAAIMPGGTQRAIGHLTAASEFWAMHGESYQAAAAFISAGELCEQSDSAQAQAWELYEQGRDILCPSDADEAALKRSSVRSLDSMRKIMKFLLKDTASLSKALRHIQLMVRLYRAFEQEGSVCKMLVAITIVQLHMRDVVSADQSFLEHLGEKGYTSSKECEVAESFLQAVKTLDAEALKALQRSELMQYLDRDVQPLAAALTLRSGVAAAVATSTVQSVIRVAPVVTGIKDSTPDVHNHLLGVEATETAGVVLSMDEEGKVSGNMSVNLVVQDVLPSDAAAPETYLDADGEDSDDDLR